MESDRQRWLEAMTPKQSLNPNESIYEEWDCPQVIAIYEFTSAQPDELSLCIGDVVNVLKKMNDGTLNIFLLTPYQTPLRPSIFFLLSHKYLSLISTIFPIFRLLPQVPLP